MSRNQAIDLSSQWVQARYPITPPLGMVWQITEAETDCRHLLGKWVVTFCCSWDTDALGLPLTLILLVDTSTGIVQPMPIDV